MSPRASAVPTKEAEPQCARQVRDFGAKADATPSREQLLRQAVALWLRWNEAYEQATVQAFQARHDQRQLEAIMDEMDSVRRQAIAVSKQALAELP